MDASKRSRPLRVERVAFLKVCEQWNGCMDDDGASSSRSGEVHLLLGECESFNGSSYGSERMSGGEDRGELRVVVCAPETDDDVDCFGVVGPEDESTLRLGSAESARGLTMPSL